MSNAAPAERKNFLLSKTFWVNLVAIASLASPAVQDWLASNPESFLGALGAVNILLRFVTKGAVSFSKDGGNADKSSGGSGGSVPLALMLAGSLMVASPPACSAAGYPVDASVFYRADDGARVGIVYRGK